MAMTPDALAASKLTALLVAAAVGLFGAFVFIVLGPRRSSSEDEGSPMLEWLIETTQDGWGVTTAALSRAWRSRAGDVIDVALFVLCSVFVYLPVGLYVRAVSAIRRAGVQ
jgi:4-amino-4-deoxy-L-arabinose transferase-like glycosyltransferase